MQPNSYSANHLVSICIQTQLWHVMCIYRGVEASEISEEVMMSHQGACSKNPSQQADVRAGYSTDRSH